jgi:hypothetical protein
MSKRGVERTRRAKSSPKFIDICTLNSSTS